MRTTAIRWPSTSKRCALPGSMSSREHTRISATGAQPPDLLVDLGPQRLHEGGYCEPVEHVIEEAEHDEPLRVGRRHTASLEVVELLVVDRTHRRRMRAADVVGLDLEVRDRLRAGALGEHEIAVGLEG